MAAAASLMGLVNQLQGMESQFSMVLMEAAMKIASFTDASIFLLIDTPEGRSWVGRKNLKEEFINGRMQIRPNDVEFDVNPNVSALVRQPTIAEKMADQQMQMQQQMQMNQMRQTAMRGGGAGRGRGFPGQSSPSGMSPGGESRKRSLPGAGGGTPNKQGRPDDSEVVAVNIKEEDLESDQDLKNVIGRVGVGDTGGSNGDGAEEGEDDSDIEEIVEEKPPMGGAGDDSSSSFLDFPGGGGYDPNQPGSSRDLVPAGNQAVATGAAGQKNILSAFGIRPTCSFTAEQKNVLANYFAMNKYPSDAESENLSQTLGITIQQVKKWFANKRTREKAITK